MKYPKAVGAYSTYYESGELIFLSGQIGLEPKTMKIVEGGIENETTRVLDNIKGVLTELNIKVENVIKTTIFLKSIGDFEIVNKIYSEFFYHKPARSCVEVSNLPKGALIEIEVIIKKI